MNRAELALLMSNHDMPDPADVLASLLRRPAWHAHAACHGQGTDAFFPERGQDTRPAKAMCHTCPVRSECLGSAVELDDHHGIWGGTSERQRRQLRSSVSRDTDEEAA